MRVWYLIHHETGQKAFDEAIKTQMKYPVIVTGSENIADRAKELKEKFPDEEISRVPVKIHRTDRRRIL